MAYTNPEDQKRAARAHYEKNKAEYIARAKVSKPALLLVRRQYVWDYLSQHPCVDCGESDPVVLQFDHVRGDKVDGIAEMVRNITTMDRLNEEISKCDVRCANCHARKTAVQLGFYQGLLV